MPTVLIGIVCISFEASSERLNAEKADNDKFRIIMSRLEQLMPEYVTFEVSYLKFWPLSSSSAQLAKVKSASKIIYTGFYLRSHRRNV